LPTRRRSDQDEDPEKEAFETAWSLVAIIAVVFIFAIAFQSCGSVQEYQNVPLIQRVLRVLPSHPDRLTNRACLRYENGACTNWDVSTYSLEDAATRDLLVRLRFVCQVAGERFKVCPDRPGFCQYTYVKKWALAPRKLVIKYVPLSPSEFHVSAATTCLNESENSFGEGVQ
jgi:hypothetical protein